MAQALLLWRKKKWSEIRSYLDENYRLIAENVMQSCHSPVLKIGDHLFTKRWASIALEGQITKQLTEAEKSSLPTGIQVFVQFGVCYNSLNFREGSLDRQFRRNPLRHHGRAN
jgi:hypothetical protein